MEINGWFSGCLVQAFPWIDGKYIYVNVRRFLPGQCHIVRENPGQSTRNF